MSYTIDLIDTIDDTHTTIFERAGQGSVILGWQGADEKDSLKVVGSSLDFTLVDPTNQDAFFLDLFTANEKRFRVHMFHTETGATVWNGFVLPDQYGEPYTNQNTFVQFTATDGLGRLKGKYLPDSFYDTENSISDIFTALLALTGLSLELFFLPAIENSIEKDWQQIYIAGVSFTDNKKKINAHSILEQLMNDMVCCVYQSDNG